MGSYTRREFIKAGLAAPLAMRAAGASPPPRHVTEAVSLAGGWRFALDREDAGVKEQWFARDLTGRIALPGILQAQGYGDEIGTETPWVLSLYDRFWYLREDYKAYAQPGNVKVPFLSQPPLHYLGPAWYQRDVEIPGGQEVRRFVLTLERPHWETTVWVDGRLIGSDRSLVAPHTYDLGQLAPGTHRLTVRVDNRLLMPYRPDAHSVSDSLGGSWNGIVGRIELGATGPVWIEDAQVFPNVSKKTARVFVRIGNMTGEKGEGKINALVGGVTSRLAYAGPEPGRPRAHEIGRAAPVSLPVKWDEQGGRAEFEVQLDPDAEPWDEFHRALQVITLSLSAPLRLITRTQYARTYDVRTIGFGLRELRAEGNQFILNGRPVVFRGTHFGGDFPLTGYPATDFPSWSRIISTCQRWGLNHMRFHSWSPPEAAYDAADALGFYLQVEPGMWNEISPGTPMERMLYEETERLIKAFGNHPSFVMLSASNEPKGRWKESLPRWAEHFRREDPRRLYTTGTGHTDREIPDPEEGADYLVVQRLGQKMLRGPSGWFGGDYRDSLAGVRVPVLAHELGQWVAYPDYDVIRKFTGYLRPGNYEIFRDSMAARGLLDKDKEFAHASGRFQLACYKEEVEANLRTAGLGGFQLLDLHDYLGQGTALVGLLDAFWEPKSYATPEEFRRFCGPTVPLARLTKRVLTTADAFEVEVEVAHYGDAPLADATPSWEIVDASGRAVTRGFWPARTIPLGKNTLLGKVSADLSKLKAPGAYRLSVRLRGAGPGRNRSFENEWNFCLYPSRVDAPAPRDVMVTRSWDEAEARLAAGGKVLYAPRRADLDWTSPPLDTVPVFWNRLMGPAWGRMLGLLIDAGHPALAGFPTEANFDWQWEELAGGARAVNLDRLPRELRPIVYAIDDWNRNYKLGLVFECAVGAGKLLVSAFDLENSLDTRAAARQLRRSLLDYMASARFRPAVAVTAAEMRALLFDTRVMKKLGASAEADAGPPNVAALAVDGDPNTFWLAGDQKKGRRHPHELTVSFPAPTPASGLILMPRQNHREHEGDIREYVVAASDDGGEWREVARGELASTFGPQRVLFPQTVTARRLRLTALSGFGPDATAALAELAVIYAGPKLADEADDTGYKRNKAATTDIDEGADAARPAKPPPGRKPKGRPPRP